MQNNYLKMLLLLVGFVLTNISIEAAVLKGKIVDADEGSSLIGAKVWLNNKNFNGISNKNGEFTILNVPAGSYELSVYYMGYEKHTQKIEVSDEKSSILKIDLKPKSIFTDKVVVIGEQLKGQAQALNRQKSNMNITNVVSSDQAGKFPDANIGDAMKRITGITVQYDQGEARFGLIRGTAPQLNSITINGDRIPSAEGETRTVQLDLVPADMISSIELSKAITPDMDADAIGGSVNLVTKNTVNKDKLSITTGSGMNFLSKKPIWNFSATAGTRLLDDKLGFVFSGSYHNHIFGSDNAEGMWKEGPNGSVYMSEFEVRKYDVQRIRQSISGGMDYKIDDNNRLFFSTIYNHRNDWENRYRLRVRYDKGETVVVDGKEYDGLPDENGVVKKTSLVREVKGGINDNQNDNARLEDQRTFNLALSGEHLFADMLKVNWQGNWAKASEERPHERYLSYRNKKGVVKQILSDENKPNYSIESSEDLSNYTLDEISEEYQYTDDIDLNGKIDFELPLMSGDNKNKVKFGARYRSKDKKRENKFWFFEPTSENMDDMTMISTYDATDADFLAGDYKAGTFASKEYLGGLNLDNSALFDKIDAPEEYAAANFKATEKITAGYAQIEQNIGQNTVILAGARFEQTKVNYDANQVTIDEDNEDNPIVITPTKGEKSYSNFLPAVHIKQYFSENFILRAAWTNSIARPDYYNLAPYREIKVADEELSEGNTNLNPTKSMNLDLMADYYFESIGVISGGVFYKNLTDFIYTNNINDYVDPVSNKTYKIYSRPENGAKATLFGFEIAFQRQLDFDFMPDFLKGLGFYANYTFTSSEAEGLKTPGRENEKVTLPGTAANMINTSLSYEMSGLSMRVSLNYTNDYVDEFGSSEFYDRYYDTQTFLDFNASYEFYDGMRVFFEANNLTNQPLRYYQGKGHQNRTMQMEYYDRRVNFGFKFDF